MRSALLSLTLLSATAYGACNPDNGFLMNANVTHNYTLPGFIPNSSGQTVSSNATSDQWTVTVAVLRNATDLNTNLQNWLTVPAAQLEQYNTTNSTEWNPSPIICAVHLDYNLATIPLLASPDGRCTAAASSQCLSDLQQAYLSAAQAFTPPRTQQNICSQYAAEMPQVSKWPSSCSAFGKTLGSHGTATGGFNLSNHDAACPFQDLSYIEENAPSSPDNYTVYDRAVNGIVGLVYVRFGNASKDDAAVDVQIMCPSAGGPGNHTSPGSRDVVESAATRRNVASVFVSVMGVVVAMMLL
ncbi:hypothetical protein K461DRAFT_72604 [Myriangium duriaei CBS 260.36]|uniref:Uncharacterized protein n=1 Tax=Myriangium duriaei CBS 260.36 TaxID=1168546 RepID=A0A9P4MBP6_9PEZI|nr:hypothetical protein K461DRAFT_72604 [Myriangium duriaei CBS 260.36]